jgi:hypothetical protein
MTQLRPTAMALLVIGGLAVGVLAVVALMVAISNAEQAARRSATIDALGTDAARQECVDRTTVAWMETLTEALLQPPDSPEQAQAVQKLAPIAQDLSTIDERCYDEHPLPTQQEPDEVPEPAAGASGADGEDGRDGIDGRNGKDGRDGADGRPGSDGVTPPAPADGRDGRDGVSPTPVPGPAGADGQDSTVPGPTGPPGESIEGPPGPQGEQGVPGYDGSPPASLTWPDGSVCTDPDGDLHYTCTEPTAA